MVRQTMAPRHGRRILRRGPAVAREPLKRPRPGGAEGIVTGRRWEARVAQQTPDMGRDAPPVAVSSSAFPR